MDSIHETRFPPFTFRLPPWVEGMLEEPGHVYATAEERMGLAVALARENVLRGTGGPFGAAVFDLDARTLVAPGVNVVLPARWSVGHAEIIAISLAQRALGTHDLGGAGGAGPRCELVTSVEPCAMCLGALPWSGVRSLVCGARDEDARAAGFDEGAKPDGWAGTLEARGIAVARDVRRGDSVGVLGDYIAREGKVYNPGG